MGHPPGPTQSWISVAVVVAQVVLATTIVVVYRFDWSNALALTLAVAGLSLATWSIATMGVGKLRILPDVGRGARLVRTGPYQFIRHPMYSSLLLFCGGFVVSAGTLPAAGMWAALAVVLIAKARLEETSLLAAFPEYGDYQAGTTRFIPFIV
jgi:protein-S-isoprenylcysteine O-methyltransferase Ste14